MSVRYFCDGCEVELTNLPRPLSERIKGDRFIKRYGEMTHRRIGVEVMTSLDGTWNRGHLCWRCTVKVVTAVGLEESGPVEVMEAEDAARGRAS
jgi:hypothetical protein